MRPKEKKNNRQWVNNNFLLVEGQKEQLMNKRPTSMGMYKSYQIWEKDLEKNTREKSP